MVQSFFTLVTVRVADLEAGLVAIFVVTFVVTFVVEFLLESAFNLSLSNGGQMMS